MIKIGRPDKVLPFLSTDVEDSKSSEQPRCPCGFYG
jgi:hypothetical protein